MAVKKELIIEIAPNGKLTIKTEGFKGQECEDELRPIEKALGKVTSREKTSDYYAVPANQKTRTKSKSNIKNSGET